MNKTRRILAVAAGGLTLAALGAPRPVALVGDMGEAVTLRSEITDGAKVATEAFPNGKWLAPSKWSDYAAVAIVGSGAGSFAIGDDLSDESAATAARRYVEQGGTLILTGEAYGRLSTNAAASAQSLFAFGDLAPFKISKLARGEGCVFCTTQSVNQLRKDFRKAKIPLGEADDKGNYDLTPAGVQMRDYVERLRELFAGLKGVSRDVPASAWGVKPLGPAGHLQYAKPELKPVTFKKRTVYKQGLKVAGEGVGKVVISYPLYKGYAPGRTRTDEDFIAKELAWHLRKMCPTIDLELRLALPYRVETMPRADEVAIVVANEEMMSQLARVRVEQHPVGTSFIVRRGKWLFLGGERAGRSHALTYLLEHMGCRYLWPSAAHHGKIIPEGQKELYLPDIRRWIYTPAMKVRGVRVIKRKPPAQIPEKMRAEYIRTHPEFLRTGWDLKALLDEVYNAAQDENPENRDFWAWHGVADAGNLEGDYSHAHAFTHYWEKYHETHPEFFALQPNGSRDQGPMLGEDRQDRCTLCLSNEGLRKEVAKNIIEEFRRTPGMHAASLGINDGGPVSECMCEACRKLDPVNAGIASVYFTSPVNASVAYVKMTDRLMDFNNAVIALVREKFPKKKFCFMAYNAFSGLPCSVRPDPALVIYDVGGNYSSSATRPAIGSLMKWMQFGCETFWRPNLLWGHRTISPQNYARRLFADVETAKANNCVGTDFDCYSDRWSTDGFVFYMLAEALMNPDQLSFDDIAEDYFEKGFGPAAPAMKKYYDILEKLFNDVAEVKTFRRSRGYYNYQRLIKFEPLDAALAEARALAKDDPLVLKRIAFFAQGLEPARFEHEIVKAFDADDLKTSELWQQKFRTWIHEESRKDMPSTNPGHYLSHYMNACLNWLEWDKKDSTKVVFDPEHYNKFYLGK